MKLIDAEIQRLKLTDKEMAARMAISPNLFTRWRTGGARGANPSTIIKIQEGFAEAPALQARVLAAYLDDQRVGPAADAVKVSWESGNRVRETPDKKDDFTALADAARAAQLPPVQVATLVTLIGLLKTKTHLWKIVRELVKY